MRRLRGFGLRRRLVLALAVGGVLFGVASVVQAAIPDSHGVIHGCYKTSGGALRVIDTATSAKCLASETALNWNQAGPTGSRGVTGATGGAGPSGPKGPSGPQGPSDAWNKLIGPEGDLGDTAIDVVTLNLPSGNYVVSAGGTFVADSDGDAVFFCKLTGGGFALDDTFGEVNSPYVIVSNLFLGSDVALPGGGTVALNCQRTKGEAGIGINLVHITATKVATLH
jgi:hypothetical protein